MGSGSAGARACAAEAIAMRRQPEPTRRPGKRMGAAAGARRRRLRSATAGDRAAARVTVAVDMGIAGRDEAESRGEQRGKRSGAAQHDKQAASNACAVCGRSGRPGDEEECTGAADKSSRGRKPAEAWRRKDAYGRG